MKPYPNFCGPSYTSQSMLSDAELCMNWYPEQMESPGATAQWALYPTPGLQVFGTLPTGSRVRQTFSITGRMWAVSNHLYEVFTDGSVMNRGALAEDVNIATMITNGDGGSQLMITSGGNGYILDLDTNVLTLAVSDVIMCNMVDGYLIALTATGFRISDLLDGLTWDSTQFAQRTSQPDPWISMLVNYNEIWLFGSQTSEVWYDAGIFPFPFAPRPGAIMQQGIAAIYSAKVLEGTVIWLAANVEGRAQVMGAEGYVPRRISNHAVETAIASYDRIDDAVAWIYQDQGHPFYVLNFPSANATWVFDKNTGLWHERGTWQDDLNRFDAWHPQCHCTFDGKHIVGDRDTPNLYEMSTSFATDAEGGMLRRVRRAPAIVGGLDRLYYGPFQVQVETGLGLVTGQGSDPQMLMRTSNDGGHTWSGYRSRSAGRIGEYSKRVIWERNGYARDRVFEVSVTDPIPWRITQAFLDVTQGMAATG